MLSAKVIASAFAILMLLGLGIAFACARIGVSYGAFYAQKQVTSYGTIMTPSNQPTNLVQNPDFSQGFSSWGGYSENGGWNTGPNAYAFLDYSVYHSAAPSLRMEPDPHGNTPGDPACWSTGWPMVGGQTVRVSVWVRTDTNPNFPYNTNVPYGARMCVDFRDSSGKIMNNAVLNCTVPVVDGCPVVSWGTSVWTLIDFYCVAPPTAVTCCMWLQVYPPQSGVTLSCWFDDAVAYIV